VNALKWITTLDPGRNIELKQQQKIEKIMHL